MQKKFSDLIIVGTVTALAACSSDPATDFTGTPEGVVPPPSPGAPVTTVSPQKGFIWSASDGPRVIPTPSYAQSMTLRAINNRGQVIGYVTLHDGQGDDRGFIWTSTEGMQRLGSLIGADGISWPLTIDDSGEVWGLSEGPSTRYRSGSHPYIQDPFVWNSASGIKPASYPASNAATLGLPRGTVCGDVVSVSTAGYAVGYAGSDDGGMFCTPMYAVMWDVNGTPVVLGEPCAQGQCDIKPAAVNNHGEVVGSYAGWRGFAGWNGFRWTRSGGFVQLPIEAGGVGLINDNGDAAGAMETESGGRLFMWMATGEIKTIELPPGAKGGGLVGLNNSGQVIGQFR